MAQARNQGGDHPSRVDGACAAAVGWASLGAGAGGSGSSQTGLPFPAFEQFCAVNFPADMNRTFPDNVKFRKSADPCLQKTLYNVLLAYGHHNQGVGYCQVSPGS